MYLSDSVTEEKQVEVPDEVPFNPFGVPKDLLLKRAQKTPRNDKETLKQYLARLTHLHLDNAGLESMVRLMQQYLTNRKISNTVRAFVYYIYSTTKSKRSLV